MLTIDRLAKIDNIALYIIASLYRGIERLADYYEARLADATYRVAEAKATAICKAEDKISALEDARSELEAQGIEAKVLLREKYKAALADLYKELVAKGDKLDTALAAAAEALVAADKDYDATIQAAKDKLDIWVPA